MKSPRLLALLLGFCILFLPFAHAQSQSTPAPAAAKTGAVPSAAEISEAHAAGKVWVNTATGIYHKSGRWYGKTKSGKFMTEADAKSAGYKPGKN